MVTPCEATVGVDIEPMGHIDGESGTSLEYSDKKTVNVSLSISTPPSETHPSSFALALDLILFDPRALGSDELVAAFVNHAHADLALVTLFAEAPERESVRCETECKT